MLSSLVLVILGGAGLRTFNIWVPEVRPTASAWCPSTGGTVASTHEEWRAVFSDLTWERDTEPCW